MRRSAKERIYQRDRRNPTLKEVLEQCANRTHKNFVRTMHPSFGLQKEPKLVPIAVDMSYDEGAKFGQILRQDGLPGLDAYCYEYFIWIDLEKSKLTYYPADNIEDNSLEKTRFDKTWHAEIFPIIIKSSIHESAHYLHALRNPDAISRKKPTSSFAQFVAEVAAIEYAAKSHKLDEYLHTIPDPIPTFAAYTALKENPKLLQEIVELDPVSGFEIAKKYWADAQSVTKQYRKYHAFF